VIQERDCGLRRIPGGEHDQAAATGEYHHEVDLFGTDRHLLRIEGVRGSNPLSSTRSEADSDLGVGLFDLCAAPMCSSRLPIELLPQPPQSLAGDVVWDLGIDALGISIAQLAGQVTYDLDLSGTWWCAWQTWKDGALRIDVHSLEIHQRGDLLQLDAERALPVAEGSYQWRGELRLWDNEALMGWYRSTDAAVRSKGALYLALHPHGTHAWGRWVGMSYDGAVITGWGAIARTADEAHKVVQDLIDSESS
jgi:hypothetical protein